MREENVTTENNAEDKPGGMHELVFSPNRKNPSLPQSPVISRYHHIPRFRSIRFNLWLTFMFMTVAMLAIIWLYELIFYSTLYVYFQENDLYSSGQSFAVDYVDYSLTDPEKLDGYIAD